MQFPITQCNYPIAQCNYPIARCNYPIPHLPNAITQLPITQLLNALLLAAREVAIEEVGSGGEDTEPAVVAQEAVDFVGDDE